MIRSAAVLVFLLCARPGFAAIPSPETPGAVAEWFAQVLRDGDVRTIEEAVDRGATSRGWREVQELLTRYECIAVETSESENAELSADAALVRIRVRATGISRARWRPRFDLPERWRLEMQRQPDGSWRLRSAMSEERAVALCMLAEPSTAQAEHSYSAATIDPLLVISSYATETAEQGLSAQFVPRIRHALALARESGSASVEADVLLHYARALAIGKQPGALALALEALEVARSRGSSTDVANALFRVGGVQMWEQRLDEAQRCFHDSAAMIHESTDPVMSLKGLHMSSVVLDQLGRYFEAVRDSERAAALSRDYGWREGEVNAAFMKGLILMVLGHLDTSEIALRHAADLAVANGNAEHAAIAYCNIAQINRQERRLDRALGAARRAVQFCPRGSWARTAVDITLVQCLTESGDLDAAERVLAENQAMNSGGVGEADDRRRFIAESVLRLRQGRNEDALAAAQAAVDRTGTSVQATTSIAAAVTQKGLALRAVGRRQEAIEAFRAAIDEIELLRRPAPGLSETSISSFETLQQPYVQLAELLAEHESTTIEALHVAEQMKARSLLETSAQHGDDLSAELSDEQRARETVLAARVADANRALYRGVDAGEAHETALAALHEARLALSAFRSEMRAQHPHLAQRDAAIPSDLRLPDADAVEFVVGERQTLAFIVPSAARDESIRTIAIAIERDTLRARIEKYRRALSSRSFAYRAEARALYDTLIAPIGAFARAAGPLYIVPDGPLWSLPFHTLIAPGGAHLAETRPIAFAPSLAILDAHRPHRSGSAGLIAFANPVVEGTTRATVRAAAPDVPLGPLPETEDEVHAISALYRDRTIHVGDAATESAFKREAAKYRILHLATHGFVAHEAPMYSGLLFSDDAANDGILEAREVADMTLGADLAVLSACDTAAGRISDGEGVVGLSWAFLAAGCPTTVVSQWKADSAATAKLMIELHRHLTRGRVPAEALRRAQMSMMRSEAHWHPYYWAPFIVVGRNHAIAH